MDTSKLPKELPSFTKEIEINTIGNITNQEYNGKFTYKIPNTRARSNISKLEARMNEGLTLDQTTSILHYMLAYLRFTILEDESEHILPKWWQESDYGYDLYDTNVVTELYLECNEYENEFNEKVFGKPEESKED